MREIMRTKTLILLAILCLLLVIFASWMAQAERELDAERAQLQQELRELKAENDALACRVAELKELQAIRDEQVVWQK